MSKQNYKNLVAYASAFTTTILIPAWAGVTLANANQPPIPEYMVALAGVTDGIAGGYIGKQTNDPDNMWSVNELLGAVIGVVSGISMSAGIHMTAYHMTNAYNKIPESARNQIKFAVQNLITRPELTDLLVL